MYLASVVMAVSFLSLISLNIFVHLFFFFYLIRLLLVSHSLPDQVLNIIDYFLKGELV
jgi:hypothetical protein